MELTTLKEVVMDPARILVDFGDPAAWPNGRADLTLGTRFNSCSLVSTGT